MSAESRAGGVGCLRFVRGTWLAGVALAMACAGLTAPATADAQVAQTIEATVLLRALSYDRNLKQRAGSELVVAVSFEPANASSRANAESVRAAFAKLDGAKVQGLSFRVLLVPYEDATGLASVVQREGVDLVYVCPGLATRVPGISAVTRELDVLTAGAVRADVVGGLALGVFTRSGKRIIVVNLDASKAEGADFSAQFLNLAEIVR